MVSTTVLRFKTMYVYMGDQKYQTGEKIISSKWRHSHIKYSK